MKPNPYVLAISLCLLAPLAHADIFKCTDENGGTTYTNERPAPGKGRSCTLLQQEPVNTIPALRRPAGRSTTPASPASFPRVDESTQRARDNSRQKILQNELDSEQKQLADARKELEAQKAVRNGDERNYQKYLDRIKGYEDKVALHERNVEALNKELSRLR